MSKFVFFTREYIDMSAQMEETFNKWYWEEHIPAINSVPGASNGRRYRIIDAGHPNGPHYLTMCNINSPEVVQSYEWNMAMEGSEWLTRLSLHFKDSPGVYETMFPHDVDDSSSYPEGDYLFVTRMTPTAAGEDEFNHWYSEYHTPEMSACPGVISGRRFARVPVRYPYAPKYLAIYELADPEVPASEAWKVGASRHGTADVLSRTRLLKSVNGVYQRMRQPG